MIAACSFVATFALASLVCWMVDSRHAPETEEGQGGAADAEGSNPSVAEESVPTPSAPTPSALASVRFPTDRGNLLDSVVTNAYVPTNAEIPETALYGSARTGFDGRSRFHKGVDIAPVRPRTRKGEPTDPVYAIADGTVLYVNRIAGNSSYGIHVVLLHDDPAGSVYSLYAHLASATAGLRAGVSVRQGDELGILGRTSSVAKIPTWNAHVHFETGLMQSSRFGQWERETKQKPLRGNGHGWNLLAADPREVFRAAASRPGGFSMLGYLQSLRPACTLVLHVRKPLDYFSLHPALWRGAPVPSSGADIVLGLTDSGLILSGRLAEEGESARLAQLPAKGARVAVLGVDEALLGRNGMRIVVQNKGVWRFGTNPAAQRWLEILQR